MFSFGHRPIREGGRPEPDFSLLCSFTFWMPLKLYKLPERKFFGGMSSLSLTIGLIEMCHHFNNGMSLCWLTLVSRVCVFCISVCNYQYLCLCYFVFLLAINTVEGCNKAPRHCSKLSMQIVKLFTTDQSSSNPIVTSPEKLILQ